MDWKIEFKASGRGDSIDRPPSTFAPLVMWVSLAASILGLVITLVAFFS